MHCVLYIIRYFYKKRNTMTLNYYLTTNFITTILMYNICVKWRKGGSFCEEKSNRWFFKAVFNNIYTIFVNKSWFFEIEWNNFCSQKYLLVWIICLFFLHTITQKRTTFRSQFYELNVVLSIKITLVFQYFMYASKNQL